MKQNKRYKENIEAIRSLNPEIVKQIEEKPEVDWIEEIKSKNKKPNLLIRSESNEMVHCYSLEDPKKEAQEKVKHLQLYKQHVTILMGCGLGYLTKEIFSKMEKGHHIIIAEPCTHILRLFLSKVNIAKKLLNGSLSIAYPGKTELVGTIGLADATRIVTGWEVTTEKYVAHRPTEYGELMTACEQALNQVSCNIGTVSSSGAKIADNDITNLPYVIRHRGIIELKDLFKNKPAILVSTGPSLAKNIHHLIGLEDRAVIICVGQALRPLLGYDIRPDFSCTVDFGDVNIGHFKGLMDCGVPLVALNRCYAPLLKAWKGPKFVVATPVPGFEKTVAGVIANKGFVDQGGSVAHLSLALAKLLGCDPIVFVGQDLALSDTSHIKQVDAGGKIGIIDGMITWEVTDPRSHLHGKKYGMGPPMYVPGYFGEQVLTNAGLLSFITSFENMVNTYTNVMEPKTKLIINATQGGAHIKGTKRMSLKDVIEKYCQKPINKKKVKPLLSPAKDGDKLIRKAIPLLKKDIETLEIIIKQSRLGLAVNHGIGTMTDRSARLSREDEIKLKKADKKIIQSANTGDVKEDPNILSLTKAIKILKNPVLRTIAKLSLRNYKFSSAAFEASKSNALIGVAIYGASRRIASRELSAKANFIHTLKSKKDSKIRIERNRVILTAAKEAAESLIKSYKETLELLQKYDKTKDKTLLVSQENEPINLNDAEKFFEEGNFARPLLEARRILKFAQDKSTSFADTQALSIEEKALKMRKEAIEKAEMEEKENDPSKLIQYVELIDKSKEFGRNEKYEEATKCLEDAIKLMPEREEAKWGLATAMHHNALRNNKAFDEAIDIYMELISDYPENHRYRFELGQTLLDAEKIQEGLKEIGLAMTETDEFDSYLGPLGDLYYQSGLKKEALLAYDKYLEKYPGDYRIKSKRDKLKGEIENENI